MSVVVERIGVVVGEVPAVDVVDEAVAVVVDAVTGHVARVVPGIGRQIRMVVVHAGVDDGHHHAAGAGGRVPRLRGIDVGVDDAARLAAVVEAPELAERRVVRGDGRGDHEVWLDVSHSRRPCRPAEHVLRRRARSGDRKKTLAQRCGLPPRREVKRRDGRGRRGADDPRVGPHVDRVAIPVELPEGRRGRVEIGRQQLPGLEQFDTRTHRGVPQGPHPAVRPTKRGLTDHETGTVSGAFHGCVLPCCSWRAPEPAGEIFRGTARLGHPLHGRRPCSRICTVSMIWTPPLR